MALWEHAMDTLLLYIVPVCAVVALFLIYYLPRRLIPATRSSRQEDLIKTVESRNEVRKTYAQLFAGASFVATFLLSIYNFNRDFNQKARQSAAEQFIKTSEYVKAAKKVQWTHVNAFEIMAMTAREDGSFNAAVFGTMGQFILEASKLSCAKNADAKADYQMSPELQRIAQIFAGNNVPDPWGKQMNMAGACLSRAQLQDSSGLQLLWLKDARLIGTEFINSNLRGSNIVNAKGGINLTDWWTDQIEVQVKTGGYDAVWNLFNDIGQYHWVNFRNATLDNVVANEANLEGAVFYSASMMNSQWSRADLSFSDLGGANLRGAMLNGTIFTSASLQSTSLEDADLTDATLDRTNMQDAFFANTIVTGVDFRSVKGLRRAQLRGMCISPGTQKPTLPVDAEYRDFNVPDCYKNRFFRWIALSRAALAQAHWTK
jgi:uncharacterized protein YjbI with pentapeptide repeats